MKMERIVFSGCQETNLPGVLWLPEGKPEAMVQVIHGMTEHMGRYAALAEFLTQHAIAVAGFDLRGHGENPGDPKCASFGEGGWEHSLEDIRLASCQLKQRFGEIPHFLLGFSLGSFLLREYLGRNSGNYQGAAILGTGSQPGAVLSLMMAIVNTQVKKVGFDGSTPLVKKLSFETYNQKFKPNRTEADWLCADERQLDAYRADPLCREQISAGLFWQLLGAMKRTGGSKALDHWDKKIPVLLLSGADDPVGDAGKGVRRVKAAMDKAGLEQVELHLLPGARHDVLHEEDSGCAEQARQLLLQWILREK